VSPDKKPEWFIFCHPPNSARCAESFYSLARRNTPCAHHIGADPPLPGPGSQKKRPQRSQAGDAAIASSGGGGVVFLGFWGPWMRSERPQVRCVRHGKLTSCSSARACRRSQRSDHSLSSETNNGSLADKIPPDNQTSGQRLAHTVAWHPALQVKLQLEEGPKSL